MEGNHVLQIFDESHFFQCFFCLNNIKETSIFLPFFLLCAPRKLLPDNILIHYMVYSIDIFPWGYYFHINFADFCYPFP